VRLKFSLISLAATAIGAVAFLFANAPADAAVCPSGWRQVTVATVPVTGTQVRPCLPLQQCDPGACWSTAPAQQ
jgi:hypothetical protein